MPAIIRIPKEEAQRRLGNVPQEHAFYCHDGCYFHSLEELRAALENMSEELFSHHVTKEKNDFTNWVRDVIKDETLAKQISKANSPSQAARVVKNRVAFLRSKV